MSPLAALKESGLSEKRESLRCDLSAHLLSAAERLPIRCIATSVTRNSIVLVSMDELDEKSHVQLNLSNLSIVLEVLSCKADAQHPAIYHVTVRTQNPAYHLENFLISEGLIEEGERSGAGPQLSFEVLRNSIGRAGEADGTLLQKLGLGAEHGSKKAYTVQHEGQSLIVLLHSEFPPMKVPSLSSEEASGLLVILQRKRSHRGSRWVKIWPSSSSA